MSIRDLIPWGRDNGDQAASLFRDGERDPFLSMHREVNRLFRNSERLRRADEKPVDQLFATTLIDPVRPRTSTTT